ncbi:MAG: UDP-2,4-diacetamido-2,4,6-trideoxy-beta-L-altropyranose hydrolase [Pseudomonadota bacterium]|nr:UDP-2,4-diacetamido-2,4,6-trideoxy-beta-L-altropyranose hydrolase [Pseudomonadota bacterium]
MSAVAEGLRVAFRVDASTEIGSGHVMRCLTLADTLAEAGARCWFLMREQTGSLEGLVERRGHKALPVSTEAFETLDLVPGDTLDWLVVDHYALDYRWEQLNSACARRVMVIDDLADRRHYCNVLLDQTFGRFPRSYSGLVPQETTLLCGAEYSLLRPEFARLRRQSLEHRNPRRLRNLLISMGGADRDNFTRRALETLERESLGAGKFITVVLGPSSPWVRDVRKLAERTELEVKVLVGISNMAEVMAKQDFVIGAAGSSIWERCCLGLPSAMVVVADNQIFAANELRESGACRVLEGGARFETSLASVIEDLDANPEQLGIMSKAAAAITDGLGASRVAAVMRGFGSDND